MKCYDTNEKNCKIICLPGFHFNFLRVFHKKLYLRYDVIGIYLFLIFVRF